MIVKICGLRQGEDVSAFNIVCPDYAGIILSKGYRRTVELNDARFLASMLDRKIKKVGVYVNEALHVLKGQADYIGLDVIQLHGDEDNAFIRELKAATGLPVWKAFRISSEADLEAAENSEADLVLLDSFSPEQRGGTGRVMDTELLRKHPLKRDFILAGGLTEANINDIIRSGIKPAGLDVSSGVETDGAKDLKKMINFVKAARSL